MKKIFLLLFFVSMHFFGCANAKKEINGDCEYLKTILSQAYVNYDEAEQKNFDTEFLIKNIKYDYQKQCGVKNFNPQKFGLLVALHVTDYLASLNIIDNHLTFASEDFDCSFFIRPIRIIPIFILKNRTVSLLFFLRTMMKSKKAVFLLEILMI